MEVSSEKSKTMLNSNTNNINDKIVVNGEKLEEVTQFKYLEATLKNDSSSEEEIIICIATSDVNNTEFLIPSREFWLLMPSRADTFIIGKNEPEPRLDSSQMSPSRAETPTKRARSELRL